MKTSVGIAGAILVQPSTSPNGCIVEYLLKIQWENSTVPISSSMETGTFSPGVKRPGREADHSPPAGAEVKKMWIYTSTPIRLHGVALN
jgi:hypothetical protein